MRIVSYLYTNRVKSGDGYKYVPPGTPFDLSDDLAKKKIESGRAERADLPEMQERGSGKAKAKGRGGPASGSGKAA